MAHWLHLIPTLPAVLAFLDGGCAFNASLHSLRYTALCFFHAAEHHT